MTLQTSITTTSILASILLAIDSSKLAQSTKHQYRQCVIRANSAKVNFLDSSQVAVYAASASSIDSAYLKTILSLWAKQATIQAKAQATPNNINEIQATIYRLEALVHSIAAMKLPTGCRVHTWLTKAEAKAILSSIDISNLSGQRDYLAFALLIATGLRRTEAIQLTWQSLKPVVNKHVLEVLGKGSKYRVIPLGNDLVSRLQKWQQAIGTSGYILRSIGRGGGLGIRLSGSGLNGIVGRLGESIGLSHLRCHDCRRSFAQWHYESGTSLLELSKLLGHSNIVTTQKYLNCDMPKTVMSLPI